MAAAASAAAAALQSSQGQQEHPPAAAEATSAAAAEESSARHPALDICSLIRAGAAGSEHRSGGGGLARKLASLQWRQRYESADVYPVPVGVGGPSLMITQKPGSLHGDAMGTGATVWPCAMVLAKYLERRYSGSGSASSSTSSMDGLRVLELGAGTGAVGLMAARLGAEHVAVTDLPCLVPLLSSNIAANALGGCCTASAYSWGTPISSLDPPLAAPIDVVLASDCVVPKLFPMEPLADALLALARHGRSFAMHNASSGGSSRDSSSGSNGPRSELVVLLSYEQRFHAAFDPKKQLLALLAERGTFRLRTVPAAEQDPVYSCDDIEIWEITCGSSTL